MPANKPLVRRIVESKTLECFLIKRLISAVIGFLVGYAYYAMSFSRAFRPEEQEYADMVKWGVLLASTIGCFVSPQCCCIAALCVPTMSAKTGRNFIQAILLAWILAGPITNIMYHATEAIRCISCVTELQENQSELMVDLMKAPIVHGLGLIVDESDSLDDSQYELEDNLEMLQSELLISAFGKAKAKEMMIEEKEAAEKKKESAEEETRKRIKRKAKVARQGRTLAKKPKSKRNKRNAENMRTNRLGRYGKINSRRNNRLHSLLKRNVKRADVYIDEEEYLPNAPEEEFTNETEAIADKGVELAENMKKEGLRVCNEIFDKAYNGCCELADTAWATCMGIILVPIYSHVICQIVYWVGEAKCNKNIRDKKDKKCKAQPDLNNEGVNDNYSFISYQVENVHKQFDMKLLWKKPSLDERAAVMTIQEITQGVKADYKWRMMVMNMCVSIAKKVVAITIILVLKAAAGYNTNYLTDYNFDNFYISSYFAYKDKKRKKARKRHLLPLTKIESKYVLRPTDFKFTAAEKKSILFKIITLIIQGLFTTILFVFDEIVFFIMDLIARHGKSDYHVTGRHRLEANIDGNGTVSDLLRVVFSGFLDNDHSMELTGSNEECMPHPHKLEREIVTWSITGYSFLICLILVEGYLLRIRRVICGIFYPRREKRRIIHLYNNLLRQRKQHIFSVRKAVLKLALTKRLNQKYSFLEAIRIRYPKIGKILFMLGYGKLRCLICETPETSKHTLWRCSNVKCRMLYCNICWIEVDEMCWACNSYRGVEKALPNTIEDNQATEEIEKDQQEIVTENQNLLLSDEEDSETSL
uniref:protein sneaky-like n=1 Tax=Styela clava TaxID=7725 RepID=UPI00193A1A94|nr:protein sneaky-like [Styela clava]